MTHRFSPTARLAVDRRRFLAVAGAFVAAGVLSPRALAQALAPTSLTVGDFTVTPASDGALTLPIAILAPDAPLAEVEALLTAAGATIVDGKSQAATTPTLLRRGAEVVLFDVGYGVGAGGPDSAGKLVETLALAGVTPEQVTHVVLTHGHPDHVFGLTGADGALTFPNAAYAIGAAEHDFWMDPELKSKMPAERHGMVDGIVGKLSAVGDRFRRLKGDDEIVSGVAVIETFGHTPGHLCIEIAGGDGLILTADLANNVAVHFPHPDWRFGFDAIGELAVASRRMILERSAAEKKPIHGYHWPYPGVGVAEIVGSGFRFAPIG